MSLNQISTRYILAAITFFAAQGAIAQTTVTLQPNAANGKDAVIWDLQPSSNFGNHADFAAVAGTNSGNASILRSFIDFDWSVVPAGATINSAYLSLYSYNSPNNGTHNTTSGSNASELRRVTSTWDESTINWGNQPATSTQNMVTLPMSTSSIQDYLNIDVTALVQDMINNPSSGYGFMIKLVTEQYYRTMLFASSDNTDPNLHPKLVLTYTESNPGTQCITLRPNAVEGKDAVIGDLQNSSNFGNHADFAAVAGTNGGNSSILRSLIDFDWSVIPSGATISSASLSLYSYNSPNNGSHNTTSGSNASELRRITSTWDENTVTWDNQPSSSTQNMVTLPMSTSSIQDYLNIDVTALVQDIVNNPSTSYGFMLKLVTEQYYRAMIFGSSDNTDSNLHPKLDICYNADVSVNENNNDIDLNIYPNPFNDFVNIEINYADQEELTIVITDVLGKVVFSSPVSTNITRFSKGSLPNGIYILNIINSNQKVLESSKLSIE